MALLITYRKIGPSDAVLGNGLSRFKTQKYIRNAMTHGYRVYDMPGVLEGVPAIECYFHSYPS